LRPAWRLYQAKKEKKKEREEDRQTVIKFLKEVSG
jgi:hypothetical protein